MPPIHLSTNFFFDAPGVYAKYDYTRTANPTRDLAAETIAELEGGCGAIVTSSGMSAIAVSTRLLSAGDLLLAPRDCYGGSLVLRRMERDPYGAPPSTRRHIFLRLPPFLWLRGFGMTAHRAVRTLLTVGVAVAAACQPSEAPPANEDESREAASTTRTPGIQAMNAFYYYDDVEAAWTFYTETLGLPTVVDYGFAKILRVAESSYLTLVDAAEGMHSTDEPRTATLAFVTEQVEAWWDYLTSREVPMRSDFRAAEGRPHDGFVAVDPEGYLLEFERFNPHAENEQLLPRLAGAEVQYPAQAIETSRPPELGVQATVLWLYYRDLEGVERFYSDMLDRERIVDQGWAKVFPVSSSGYLGLVDGERGLHSATDEKSVTVSFFTDDVEGWLSYMRGREGFQLRTREVTDESGRVSVFIGYDPEGYFLEWDTFLDVEGNEALLALLNGVR